MFSMPLIYRCTVGIDELHLESPFVGVRVRSSKGPAASFKSSGPSQNEGLEALRVAKAAVDLSAFLRGQRTRCPARFFVGRKRAMPRTL